MKNFSGILNVILVAAVAVLYYLHFSHATEPAVQNKVVNMSNFNIAFVNSDSLLDNYLYFKNKDELYASLSLRILQYLLIRLQHVNSEKIETAEKRYKALIRAMFDVYEFDPLILINMFNLQTNETLKTLTPELLSEIKMLSCKSIEEIAIIFKQEENDKDFPEYNPSLLAEIFWSLFSGVVLFQESKKSVLGEDKVFLKKTLETAFEIFRIGIKDAILVS